MRNYGAIILAIQDLNKKGVDVTKYLERIESIIGHESLMDENVFNHHSKGITIDIEMLPNYGHRQPIKQRDPHEPMKAEKEKLERWIQDIFVRRFKDQYKLIQAEYKIDKPKKLPRPKLEKDYIDELITALVTGASDGINLFQLRLGIGMDLTKPNEYAAKWAKEYSYELIKGIDETSLKLVQDAVTNFVENQGYTIGDVIEYLSDDFGDIRASRIAVTETTRAFAEGQKAAADELKQEFPDAEIYKTWFTNNDDIVCEDCGPLDGKEVKADDQFDGGIDAPPFHVNCRCWIDYNTKL